MALIQANRESIDDRFSVLGFTVRTENPLFEIAIAAHPDLLQASNRAKRTSSNFFTTRLLGPTRRGEATYLVPPDVVARFVGQARLYFGLATYREGDRSNPASVKIPDGGSMYVNTAGLTERGLRRTARRNGAVAYGNGGDGLTWGGDVLAAPSSATPSPRNGNGAAKPPETPVPYSDGYPDDLWKQDHAAAQPSAPNSDASTPSATPAPTNGGGEPRLVTSQAYRGGQPQRMPGRARARELLVEPYDQSSSWWDTLTTQLAHFAKGAMWFLGVLDTTKPPYSAICQVRRPDGTAEGAHMGTAFFIAPRLLLTAAHVVDGQSELIIVPGKNGGGISSTTEPFGRFKSTTFRKHPKYDTQGSDYDMGLICVPADHAASSPNFFGLVEELTQSRPEGVVVSGYAAWWYATSAIEEFVNQNIDENRQHAHGGYIREIPTEGTFTYDLQTLAGTSGSPVYWIEDGAAPKAHLVGVHIAGNDNKTNRGCRVTQDKLRWIRDTAAEWSQTLTFSLGARALEDVVTTRSDDDPDAIGISEDEPVGASPKHKPSVRARSTRRRPTTLAPAVSPPPIHATSRRVAGATSRSTAWSSTSPPAVPRSKARSPGSRTATASTSAPANRSAAARTTSSGAMAKSCRWCATPTPRTTRAGRTGAASASSTTPTSPRAATIATCRRRSRSTKHRHAWSRGYAVSSAFRPTASTSAATWKSRRLTITIARARSGTGITTCRAYRLPPQRLRRPPRRVSASGARECARSRMESKTRMRSGSARTSRLERSPRHRPFVRARSTRRRPTTPAPAVSFPPMRATSPKAAGRDRVVDRVVIHITAGGPKIDGTISWFQNGDRINKNTGKPILSSAHYIIGRDGEVVQMVRNADTAHHASQANSRSIGIEHNANKPSRGNKLDLPPTQPQYEASARLVAWLCRELGIPADREHIRGHMEISPADDHDCPSSIWDWDYYMSCVQDAVAALAAPTAQGLGTRRARALSLAGHPYVASRHGRA